MRPPKKPSERRSCKLMLTVTDAEAKAIKAAAKKGGKTVSDYLRGLGLAVAEASRAGK